MPLMSEHAARQLSGLQLAFMGDTVCDLLTRTMIIFEGRNIKDMHNEATGIVNARAQSQALAVIRHLLTEDETDIKFLLIQTFQEFYNYLYGGLRKL